MIMGYRRNKPKRNRIAETSQGESVKKIRGSKMPSNTSDNRRGKSTINIDLAVRKKSLSSLSKLLIRKLTCSIQEEMPQDIKPMLATLVDEAFNDAQWQFELKLDGYRTLAYLNKGVIDLKSRNNHSFNEKFNGITSELKKWKINALVDGEIVVLNENGKPDFNRIQQWSKRQEGQLVYYVFDLLWLEGWNIMNEPLYLRRDILRQLMPENGVIRFSDHIDEVGIDFFNIAKQNNLEGIIAKKKDSPYLSDARSKTWLKIKAEQRHEAIICGYTKKNESDRKFSSLLLGIYERGRLNYLGQVGTGFTETIQSDLIKLMKPLMVPDCPFEKEPRTDSTATWIKPQIVCEVKYTELTNDGVMRHPSFQGLREDKDVCDLNNEKEKDTDSVLAGATENESADLVGKNENQLITEVDGQELKLTNLNKLYWPKEKITKANMINYYYRISDYIMPYMKDRPQSLNRFPDGVTGENFYHKNMGGKVDKWLKTFKRFSESNGEPKDFLICTNKASLIYMANLGCIEMNPWHSRIQTPNYPDWSVIDLDPGEIAFSKVIETAQVVKKILDSLNIPSFPKTSGSTGIHIYIPLGAKYNYEQSKQLAELIANMVHEELPVFTSLVRNPEKRKDKIYIDYLQNRPIQTICAPYSVRPKPMATVSAPLHWTEVKKGLTIQKFNIKNILERLHSEGDLFADVLGHGIDLNKTLKGLSSLI